VKVTEPVKKFMLLPPLAEGPYGMAPLPETVQPVTAMVPTVAPELFRKVMFDADAEKDAAVDMFPPPATVQPEIETTIELLLFCVKVMVPWLAPKLVMPTASPNVAFMMTTLGTWLQLAVPVHWPLLQGYEPMGHVVVEGASHWASVVLYVPPVGQDGACWQ
jgi:hypothetical protein